MKAKEVLRQYAAGERNFCNANLRGANFKGKDLSGADFNGADIRSANFTDATLRGTSFENAKGGLQRQWLILQWLLIILIAIVVGILHAFAATLATYFFAPTNFSSSLEQAVGFLTYVFLIVVTYVAIGLQGFSTRALGSILTAFAVVFSLTLTSLLTNGFPVAGVGTVAVVLAGAFAGAVTTVCASTGAIVFAVMVAVIGVIVATFTVADKNTTVVVIIAVIGLLFSFFVGWRVIKEDEKFDILRMFGLEVAVFGGTLFSGADLTGATFTQAHLGNTNFAESRRQQTRLNHVYWQGVQKLRCSFLEGSILQDRRVRMLLTRPEKGYKQDCSNANFRGANLSGVTLEKANLTRAVLSDALLKGTILKDAILTEAQAVGADFTNACLTGATLESWNTDSTTIFKNIDCDYVYLLEHPKKNDDHERRPHDITKMFQPGDFEKLFKEVPGDVQLLIRNGANPTALRVAFQKIKENYPDLPEDAFQSFQRRGDDFLVTVKVPQSIDKGQFERDWDSGYQAGLQAGREESAALLASAEKRADGLEAIALTMAQNPSTQNTTNNDYRQTIEVKGNVAESVIGQGDGNHLTNTPTPKQEDKTP